MAQFPKFKILQLIEKLSLIPVFYNQDTEVGKKIIQACYNAGSFLVEFTNRGDFAIEVFSDMIKHARKTMPELALGIGSIYDPYTAALYIQYGANFIVSPSFDKEIAKLCNLHKIPYIPGCASTTEIQNAHRYGVDIIKLFPGKEAGGPGFVKAIRGPLPNTKIMPTGGVEPTQESLQQWFDSGVTCVGMGSKLIQKQEIENNDFNAMEDKIKSTLELIQKIKQK